MLRRRVCEEWFQAVDVAHEGVRGVVLANHVVKGVDF